MQHATLHARAKKNTLAHGDYFSAMQQKTLGA